MARLVAQPTRPTILVSVGLIHKREQLPPVPGIIRTRTYTNWKVRDVTRGRNKWCVIRWTRHTSSNLDRSRATQQEMKEVERIPTSLATEMLRSAPRGR